MNQNPPASFAHQMDAYLDEYCRLFNFSGILRVTLRDEIIYERCIGFADIEHRIPITPDSVFTLYSISKAFCAIGFLRLCDMGLVDLDDHPAKYVPEAAGFDSRVTFRHLLTHTSGLPDFNQFPAISGKRSFNIRETVAELAKAPSHFAPGEGALYANINFVLPALTVENVSGMSYDKYMAREIFAPLAMTHAQIDRNRLLIPNRVRGYEIDGDGFCAATPDLSTMLGAGDVVGDINDVYCLNRAIKHKLILRPETWATALERSPISSYGMGCGVTDWHGKLRINHSGGHKGFRTLHIQLPEDDFDIILLSNCGFGNSREAIAEAIHTAFYGADSPAGEQIDMDAGYIPKLIGSTSDGFLPRRPDRADFSPEDEARLLGDYDEMKLSRVGDLFHLDLSDRRKLICYPFAPNLLVNAFADEIYGVCDDEEGVPHVHIWKKSL